MDHFEINAVLTVAEAARHCGVKPDTIYVWVHRGQLKPAHRNGRQLLFRLLDVARAEARTRRRARRDTTLRAA